jgi:DoxX-like family
MFGWIKTVFSQPENNHAMKKINLFYWITTGLLAALMLFSALPDIMMVPQATAVLTHLGYPHYFIPFIGVAKLLGVIAILVPRYPRLKEWAYAGLAFDLIGATYSQLATGGFQPAVFIMILPIGLLASSYYLYHRKWNPESR